MARINIEDHLFKDSRWNKLLIKTQCEYKALGLVTTAWIIAQEHWLDHKGVPAKAWPKELNILIETEFATRKADDSVYVKGSRKAFAWLEQRSEAGKKGGQSKSVKKLDAAAKNLKSNKTDNGPKRELNGPKREDDGPKPLSLTLSLTQEEVLNTDVFNTAQVEQKNSDQNGKTGTHEIIARYCELWQSMHRGKAPITGKDAGIFKRLVKDLGKPRMLLLIEGYFQIPDAWAHKKAHDLYTFQTKLSEIARFVDSGNFVPMESVRKADSDIHHRKQNIQAEKQFELETQHLFENTRKPQLGGAL